MDISELIDKLERLREEYGDIEIEAFHHEGGSSHRAYPGPIDERTSFVKAYKKVKCAKKKQLYLVIGGWYK